MINQTLKVFLAVAALVLSTFIMTSRTIQRGCFEADYDAANLGTRSKQPEKQSLLRSRRALEVATGIRFASLDPTIGPCIAIQESKRAKGLVQYGVSMVLVRNRAKLR